MQILGIDIGGSGIKGAPVDIEQGTLLTERFRLPTPNPSTPAAVASAVAEVVHHFDWHGPIGCTFPAVIKSGVALSAANVDKTWIGTNGQKLFEQATGCSVLLINDADAAGIAEMRLGAGKDQNGVVILLTFGTGIGSALFVDRVLVPNTEFGHMTMGKKEAEERASARAREEHNLSWKKWANRVDEYLDYLTVLFSPDLFIIGGGVSKDYAKFLPLLTSSVKTVPAEHLNDAGILGAALAGAALVKEQQTAKLEHSQLGAANDPGT